VNLKPILPAIALAVTLAAPASAETWDCTFKPSRGNGTPERAIIQRDANTGRVMVNDNLIKNYVGSPLEGRLRSKTSSRVWVTWELPSLKDNRGHWIPGIVFSVNITLANGAATISGTPQGNYQAVRSSGSCKTR
jgi:hypothetical protein